jgi:hypothetical protein
VETGENQVQVSSRSHTPLGIRQTTPDSHIPTAPAVIVLKQTKRQKTERKSAAAPHPNPDLFQDHVALEPLSRFRIIRRLENADV